jgi:SpoVK/Ycf46/Vps4 family AAA+-type ATPase
MGKVTFQQTRDSAHKPAIETTVQGIYDSGRKHLIDELLKLDAFIQLRISNFRNLDSGKKPDSLDGLCITDEEINGILKKESRVQREPSPRTGKSQIEVLLNHIERLQAKISKKVEKSLEFGIYLPLAQLSHIFHLSPFEQDAVLICLAPELDLKYEKLYAYLQDDVTKQSPSVNLILDLLCSTPELRSDARTLFHPKAPLLKYGLIRVTQNTQAKPLLSRSLEIDDRIVNFLLDLNSLDSRINSFAKVMDPERDWSAVLLDNQCKERLIQLSKDYVKQSLRSKLIFCFWGPYGSGKKLAAEAFCRELKLPLIIADIRDLLSVEMDFEKAVRILFREAVLQPAAIYLDHFDLLTTDEQKYIHYWNILDRAIEEFSFITFLAGEKPWHPKTGLKKCTFLEIQFPVPAYHIRKDLWKMSLNGQYSVSSEVDIDVLAGRFQFTGGQIQNAIADAGSLAIMRRGNDNNEITMEDFYQSCHAQSNHKLSTMAQKIVPHYTWADIVLPSDKLQQLKEVSNYVKYRPVVYDDWGFGQKLSLGKGLNVLFSGPSGTGKTMAAEIIANELKLDLYKIDLSCVVSKYIGETEKNLAKIFREAETSNAILFFDEADALFGKRSEVKDSHDRYANIEINYLLQKMEEHEGIAILASNFRKNIDEAFTRRMHFSVDFPFPGENYRLKIWQNIFPQQTPVSEDIDFKFLAKRFKISGGNIKNIALHAAFLAAEDSGCVSMDCTIFATKREFQKMGKLCVQSDFGKYYDLIMPKE